MPVAPRSSVVGSVAALLCAAAIAICVAQIGRVAPAADHHMHLQSTRMVGVLVRLKQQFKEVVEPGDRAVLGAAEAIAALDAAGIPKAAVLSGAYLIGSPDITIGNELREVQAENSWTAAQAGLYPARLTGFCSVNPLKPYAEAEVARCASIGLRGLKLHLTNSAVELSNPAHLARLASVVGTANRVRMPLLIHMRTRAAAYGAKDARALFEQVLPAAPDVPVVIAHMAGWGGYDRATDAALGAFAAACAATPEPCRRLWFELAMTVIPEAGASAPAGTSLRRLADAQRDFPDANQRLTSRIRSLGAGRVLFGSDWPSMTPIDSQEAVRRGLPLQPDELKTIFTNTAPYLR